MFYGHFLKHNGLNNSVKFSFFFLCAIVNTTNPFVESLSLARMKKQKTKKIIVLCLSQIKKTSLRVFSSFFRGQVKPINDDVSFFFLFLCSLIYCCFFFLLSLHSILLYIIIYLVRSSMFCLYVCLVEQKK